MNFIEEKKDLNNIRSETEFTEFYIQKFGSSINTKQKLKEIFNYIKKNPAVYDLTKIYYEICLLNYIPGGPGLSECRSIIDSNKEVKKKLYENEPPEKIHMKTGIWKCNTCNGTGMIDDLLLSKNGYEFKKYCPDCNGDTMKLGNNKFEFFMNNKET